MGAHFWRISDFFEKILSFCCDWKEKRISILRWKILCNLIKSTKLTLLVKCRVYALYVFGIFATAVEVDTIQRTKFSRYFEPCYTEQEDHDIVGRLCAYIEAIGPGKLCERDGHISIL